MLSWTECKSWYRSTTWIADKYLIRCRIYIYKNCAGTYHDRRVSFFFFFAKQLRHLSQSLTSIITVHTSVRPSSRSWARLTLFVERSRSTIVSLLFFTSSYSRQLGCMAEKRIGKTEDAKHAARYREGEIRIPRNRPGERVRGLTSGEGARCYFRPLDF